MLSCLPFRWFYKRRCKYCHRIMNNAKDKSFCDRECEIYFLYRDSFHLLDSSLHKYILTLDL